MTKRTAPKTTPKGKSKSTPKTKPTYSPPHPIPSEPYRHRTPLPLPLFAPASNPTSTNPSGKAQHTTWLPIKIHTAKCDICNLHNKSVLYRCNDCGWQVCTPCWRGKAGVGGVAWDGVHSGVGGVEEKEVVAPVGAREGSPDTEAGEVRVEKKKRKGRDSDRRPGTKARGATTANFREVVESDGDDVEMDDDAPAATWEGMLRPRQRRKYTIEDGDTTEDEGEDGDTIVVHTPGPTSNSSNKTVVHGQGQGQRIDWLALAAKAIEEDDDTDAEMSEEPVEEARSNRSLFVEGEDYDAAVRLTELARQDGAAAAQGEDDAEEQSDAESTDEEELMQYQRHVKYCNPKQYARSRARQRAGRDPDDTASEEDEDDDDEDESKLDETSKVVGFSGPGGIPKVWMSRAWVEAHSNKKSAAKEQGEEKTAGDPHFDDGNVSTSSAWRTLNSRSERVSAPPELSMRFNPYVPRRSAAPSPSPAMQQSSGQDSQPPMTAWARWKAREQHASLKRQNSEAVEKEEKRRLKRQRGQGAATAKDGAINENERELKAMLDPYDDEGNRIGSPS